MYVEASNGIRHVGQHISSYMGSDLVLIGSNIPHLNFDYGIKGPYEKIVVQLKEDFLNNAFSQLPELATIRELFEKARNGISFYGDTKQRIGERLKAITTKDRFQQLLEMLSIFQELAKSKEMTLLHSQPIDDHYNLKEQQRIRSINRFIEENHQRKIDAEEVAALVNLSLSAFCRYFKKMTRLTFTEFLNQYRINQAKKLLLQDKNVTEACYESGFASLSYFNRTFKKVIGKAPGDQKDRREDGNSLHRPVNSAGRFARKACIPSR